MPLEFNIEQILHDAEDGQNVSFSGELDRIWEPKERKGAGGPFTTQGMMIVDKTYSIEYSHVVSSKSPEIPQSAKGRTIHIENATYSPYEWKGETRPKVQGGKYTIDGLSAAEPNGTPASTSNGKQNGKQNGRVLEDYLVMACGFAVLWTKITERLLLPPEAIDPIAKRVDTVIIQNHGINLDRVRLLGTDMADDIIAQCFDKPDEVRPQDFPPDEDPVLCISEEEISRLKELWQEAKKHGCTKEKAATMLQSIGASSWDTIRRSQYETVAAYFKEWRS